MKIILAAQDAKGRNVVFVSDTLQAYSLEEAIRLARMRELADRWKKFVDLNMLPQITATLYSFTDSRHPPHANPQPSNRGSHIVDEFYQLAKEWLK